MLFSLAFVYFCGFYFLDIALIHFQFNTGAYSYRAMILIQFDFERDTLDRLGMPERHAH